VKENQVPIISVLHRKWTKIHLLWSLDWLSIVIACRVMAESHYIAFRSSKGRNIWSRFHLLLLSSTPRYYAAHSPFPSILICGLSRQQAPHIVHCCAAI